MVFSTEGIGLRSASYPFVKNHYQFGIDVVSEPIGSPPQNGTDIIMREDPAIMNVRFIVSTHESR